MKASEMTNEELAECIESARLAPAKYVLDDDLNFHSEAIREAAARLRNLGEIGEAVGREATREKASQVGNAEKMREALLRILGIADHLQTRFAIPRLASEENIRVETNSRISPCRSDEELRPPRVRDFQSRAVRME